MEDGNKKFEEGFINIQKWMMVCCCDYFDYDLSFIKSSPSFYSLWRRIIIYSFIHLFIYSFIHLFIYSFIHLFIYSFIHLFIYSFIHLFIYSFIHLFIYSFIHLLIYSFIHLFVLTLLCLDFKSTSRFKTISTDWMGAFF